MFDRYYYDLLVDSQRYRYGGSHRLAILVGKFIPEPDIIILLDAPPEVLLQRKQEVTKKEAIRQRTAYRNLVGSFRNGNIVDSSQSLEQVVFQVEQIVLQYMTNRASKRLGLARNNRDSGFLPPKE
jgi:thymidylate kinase